MTLVFDLRKLEIYLGLKPSNVIIDSSDNDNNIQDKKLPVYISGEELKKYAQCTFVNQCNITNIKETVFGVTATVKFATGFTVEIRRFMIKNLDSKFIGKELEYLGYLLSFLLNKNVYLIGNPSKCKYNPTIGIWMYVEDEKYDFKETGLIFEPMRNPPVWDSTASVPVYYYSKILK